mmetsp:Transcript_32035/g.85816  ORF Transcript_32035/g.85816 Transcript_32035/m.85816 type:complete len:300 (-) Transcript_32035:708-1607(-)
MSPFRPASLICQPPTKFFGTDLEVDSPRTPRTPRTPVRPAWAQRCDKAAARCPYPTSFFLAQSHKSEDRLTVDCQGEDGLWAVFDGHRSKEVSSHSSRTVAGLVWSNPAWPSSPGEALQEALWECHESARRQKLQGGTTAVVVAATGGLIWCCSAGDSRVVAALGGSGSTRMSFEHTTDVLEEKMRISAQGGKIEFGGVGGMLPMTRGIGNFDLEADGFACLPQVACIPRASADFVVIASDGLWDVIDDDTCCTLVRQSSCTGVAQRLAEHARALGSCDDIAVVVVHFPRTNELGATWA